MRVLQRYILADFLVSFFMTLSVITFVMCLGVVIRAIDIAARGVSGELIAKLFLLNIPYMMTFSIPMGVLTASLLLFGRLSFDGELTAMRACGLSIWQIISPIVIASVLFTGICTYINTTVAPQAKEMSRELLRDIGMEQPINLLEVGRFVQDFPGLMIYIGSRDGNNVTDVVVYERDESGPVRNVRAQRGVLRTEEGEKALFIDLYGVRIDQRESGAVDDPTKSHYINAEFYPVKLDFSSFTPQNRRKKPSDMTLGELITKVRDVRKSFPDLTPRDLYRQRTFLIVEVNKRFAMAMSCFAFALIGIPLGMKSRRKESSIGVGIALALVFFFYLFLIIANSLVGRPELRPDLVVWLPVILCEVIGFVLIWRMK
ncbi:MAG TPA: LptF/LptG family permease [Kiritimatiellia bacterium]|nr:LptF/LptG family permease [Kiritimatiellia bacterium]HMO99297.1 LptF/LptG family permease [Kiritimatiellia bacterium]HMP95629.1 LptF/LptG family permease [Kiritimatiellia bacterium]